jgi:hypothetical protein
MSGEPFGDPSLTRPVREFRSDSAEPRLFPGSRSPPVEPAALAEADMLSADQDKARVSVASPTISAPDRNLAAAGRLPVGTLLYLVVIGLVAAMTIGAFCGVGFLLLAGPANKTIAASEPGPARPPAPRADRDPKPVALEPGQPLSAAAAAIPDSPLAQPSADEAAPWPQSQAARALPPASPASEPPAQTGPAPEPAARRGPASTSLISPAAPPDMATRPPSALEDAAPQNAANPPARHGRSDHARTASRYSHLRSARNGRSPAPRRARLAQSSPPQAGQMSPMDQLLTQLTEQPKPVGQSLTPPATGQTDPSAPRASNR